LAAELLNKYEYHITSITLIPSEGGRFEVVANEQILYSKLKTGRHANPGEVSELVNQALKKGSV
jgi:selenoprotein W-related protein